jgi:hypothetical protein
LEGTQISDASIDPLARLERLESLDLRETRVSEDGIAELRRRLPDCTVRWTP